MNVVSTSYVYKANLSTESISSIPATLPAWARSKISQRTSGTWFQPCTWLEWARRPSARSFVGREKLLVRFLRNGRNIKLPSVAFDLQDHASRGEDDHEKGCGWVKMGCELVFQHDSDPKYSLQASNWKIQHWFKQLILPLYFCWSG